MSERSLAEEWDAQADAWARFVRTPGQDHYYHRYNWPCFLELVPQAGRATLDLGCGEGRGGHPFASAHLGRDPAERRSYFDVQRTLDEVDRDGVKFAFHQIHRPLEAWTALFLDAGLLIEALREPRPSEADVEAVPRLGKSRANPAFLHLSCRR